jgi:SAM-dependent methyltransferase
MPPTPAQVLDRPLSYRLWQAPFAESKFAPVLRHNDLTRVRRVLDVGCGPGTNARHFTEADYVGIDLNERYVEYARRQHGREFEVADATEYTVAPGERFDFVLINSFLHHIPDEAVRRLLDHLSSVLTEDGHIHIMELVLPAQASAGRLLARLDRGEHPRPLEDWRRLLTESFDQVVFEPYRLGAARWARTTLWNMVYFKGRARAPQSP